MTIRKRLTAILCFAMLVPGVFSYANESIENSRYRVTVDTHQQEFSITALPFNKPCVKEGSFYYGIRSVSSNPITDTVWGSGMELAVEHDNGWLSTFRIYDDCPFIHIQTTVVHHGSQPLKTPSIALMQYTVDLGLDAEALRSYGSGGLHLIGDAPGSFSFEAIVDPDSRRGVVSAFLTHEQGSGVFETMSVENHPRVEARIDFGHFQVDPEQSRETETMLIGYFNDARLGLEAYADAVARQYAISLPPRPSVYCTWYHAGSSNEEKLLANAKFSQTNLQPYGLSVMQIDDKWQEPFPKGLTHNETYEVIKDGGPVKVFVEANDNFPQGMEYTAGKLTEMGFVPGIWFMPFVGNWKNPFYADKQDLFAKNPGGTPFTTRWSGTILDLSNPKTQEFVRQRVKRIHDWGYRYFKLDGMHTGAITHNVYVNSSYSKSGTWQNKKDFGGGVLFDPHYTPIEAYRKGLDIVRESAPDTFILGCNVSQNMRSMGAAFGKIDAMRIGPDNGGAGNGRWDQVITGAWHGTNLYFLNGRVWHNDPDPVYVRPSNPLNAARLMVSWVAVSGSMLSTSYQFAELPPERLDLIKRCSPGHDAVARPVDLFENDLAQIWLTTGKTGGVRRDIIGLFNWNEKEPLTVDYAMDKIGLDAGTTYDAFDYWDNKFIDPIQGTLKQTLPPGSCRILALRPQSKAPQVISTSRHITQGLIDIAEETWNDTTKTLSGKCEMIADDPYQLRIALPKGKSWDIDSVTANSGEVAYIVQSSGIVRITIKPAKTATVSWSVRFQ